MLKLATLIENPGEPEVQTQYQDPVQLRALGYTGLVIYESTAMSGVQNVESIVPDELRRWVGSRVDHITRSVEAAQAAGLGVYLFYDVLALTTDVLQRNSTGLCCKGRPQTLCPASEQALELSVSALESLLNRWSGIEGVVLRFGDTDADRLPHLVGNDLYSPHCSRCSQFGRADRAITFINRFHKLVVQKLNKRLIVRAWNVRPGGMHDVPDLAGRIAAGLPGDEKDDRLMLSFKFSETDFWRYQRWNRSSLVCGDRPILYELQCQREFEGKGGVPNWQAPLWRDGYPESAELDDEVHGLADAAKRVNLAGLWAWVRGGGWGGPFVKNEQWIDANVFAVPQLADDPEADLSRIARRWVTQRLDADDDVVEPMVALLNESAELIRKAFYFGPFAKAKASPWHPNADWIQDDLLDAQSAWRIIQQLNDTQLDEAIQEKREAADGVSQHRVALQQLKADRKHRMIEPLINSLLYTEAFFEVLRDLVSGLVAYRRYQKSPDPSLAEVVQKHLFSAQNNWNHHTQRFGSLSGAATAFREENFWDMTQDLITQVDS